MSLRRGGTKEKSDLREHTSAERIMFQGQYPDTASGLTITDRTTLTREADATVRQVIEISTHSGKTWRTTFDALYRSQSH